MVQYWSLQRIFRVGDNVSDSFVDFVIDTSSPVNIKWAFTWSINASLFSLVLSNYLLITQEERLQLQVYFPSHLEIKISVSEAYILSSFPASFQRPA